MTLEEIYTIVDRDENNENFIHHFTDATLIHIHKPTGYRVKRVMNEFGDIKYGVFTQDEKILIAYASFSKEGKWYISSMPSTMIEYRKQGWMSLIYDIAINKDHLRVMSDTEQRPSAQVFWKSMRSKGEFSVKVYDVLRQRIIDWTQKTDPYTPGNESRYRLVAIPYSITEIHIRESVGGGRGEQAEYRRLGVHDHGKYGPGTSNEELGFINW